MLVADGLTVLHGQLAALRDVSISVNAGEMFAVVGANGAGKSTLLRTLAGLHRPASGVVRVDGADITHACRRTGGCGKASRWFPRVGDCSRR